MKSANHKRKLKNGETVQSFSGNSSRLYRGKSRGDGFPNTSRVLVEYGHSLIINLSTGSGSENPVHSVKINPSLLMMREWQIRSSLARGQTALNLPLRCLDILVWFRCLVILVWSDCEL